MANRIRLKGTTEESFSIALTDAAFTPNKQMDGVSLSTAYQTSTGFLEVNSVANDAGIWIAPTVNGGRLRFGGSSGTVGFSQMQSTAGNFSILAPFGSSATAGAGGSLTWVGGDAEAASNADGGNVEMFAGNGDGTGTPGYVTLEGQTIRFSLAEELQINTDPGAVGQVLTSQGAGTPPIWAAAGDGSTGLTAVQSYALTSIFGPQF